MKFYDRVLSHVATGNGTGNVTWSTAATQYALPPTGIDELVSYTILDANASAWESGRATLSESGGTYTLARAGAQAVVASSNSGNAVAFTDASTHTVLLPVDSVLARQADNSAARVVLDADLIEQSSGIVGVPWDTAEFDDEGFFDAAGNTVRLTIPAGSGITRVNVTSNLHATILTNASYSQGIWHNSGIIAEYRAEIGSGQEARACVSTGPVDVSEGDLFEVRASSFTFGWTIKSSGSNFSIQVLKRA